MIPVDQAHDDDCARACVASLLELELDQVPDFLRDNPDEGTWFPAFEQWLCGRGLRVLRFKGGFPGGAKCYYLASGPVSAKRDAAFHMVVMYDGEVVHDPELPYEGKGKNMMREGIYKVATSFLILPIDIGRWEAM